MPKAIAELTELLASFPGVGPRQARRIVQFLVRANPDYKRKLTEGITQLNAHVSQCRSCHRFDEVNEENLCALCTDTTRDEKTLMVVEKDVDVEGVEAAGVFRGKYFVLGSLLPLAKSRKTAIEPRTTLLLKRLQKTASDEIILAFATTPEGDFTAREIKLEISKNIPGAKVTILGRGLSLGAEIEYADSETLRNALKGRQEEF